MEQTWRQRMVSEKRLHESETVQQINRLLVRWKRPLEMQYESWLRSKRQ